MNRVKSTKGQRKQLQNCHIGVGFMVYHSGIGETIECEFYLNKDGIPCHIKSGKPIVFEITETPE